MSLKTETKLDQITITENGIVLVRECKQILENEIEINKSYFRYSLFPGQNIVNQPQLVKNVCELAWTKEIIEKYQAEMNQPV